MPKDSLSDEDRALFRQAVKAIPKDIRAKDQNTIFSSEVKLDIPLSDYYLHHPVEAESILSYCTQNFPNKRFTELKNGQIPWEARLDLHGLHPDQASATLLRFIESAVNQQKRCLLIIHGKGGRHGNRPVMKNLVNRWLQQIPGISAFHSARPRDGGSGALYLFLKIDKIR
jgi:DNA-nicking Smr family endonuclease